MVDLSVIIPARQEEWLKATVEDVLAHTSDRTEIIVVLDGAWANPPLDKHPRVTVIHGHQAIGQRAATNLGARISTAPFIMKLDAHCSVADGFDVALLEAAKELGPSVTQIPAQRNLHVYNRVCTGCGSVFDQAPVRKACPNCKSETFTQQVVWQPRARPMTTNWSIDHELHFQYASNKQQVGDLPEVMSFLGACMFVDRQHFLSLGGFDESVGSWGQYAQEWACKEWLSGGRVVCNKTTWFAHFFRVGGIGFPYDIKARDQEYARTYSRNLWRGNHWPGQVRPLRWLIDKFWPIKGWTEEQRDALPKELQVVEGTPVRRTGGGIGSKPVRSVRPGRDLRSVGADQPRVASSAGRECRDARGVPQSKQHTLRPAAVTAGIVYYTDNRGDEAILSACRDQLKRSVNGHAIVSATLKPLDFGKNVVLPLERSILAMFRQILAGLEALDTDYAFLVEHDVLYHESHFQFTPANDSTYFYNLNWWKVDAATGRAVTYQAKQTSQLCANRLLLVEHYRKRVARVEKEGFTRAIGFEPGSHRRKERIDDVPSDVWRSAVPNIDIRHGKNLTPSRWSPDAFRDKRNCQGWQESDAIPSWGKTLGCFSCFLKTVQRGDVPQVGA